MCDPDAEFCTIGSDYVIILQSLKYIIRRMV